MEGTGYSLKIPLSNSQFSPCHVVHIPWLYETVITNTSIIITKIGQILGKK